MAEIAYKYKKYGVAYLDILGFTSKVKDVREDAARLQKVAEDLESLETILSGPSTSKLHTHMFSDTIVLTFPKPSRVPGYGMSYLSLFQVYSAVRGFFVRGGISHGDHYEKGRVMFGPAYLEAFELEGLAVWPRVLIHPSVLKIDPVAFDWASRIVRDDLGLTFVDYLHNAFMSIVAYEWIAEYTKSEDFMPVSSQELFARHRAAILKECEGVCDLSVLSKYHALAEYHNSVIVRLVSMLQGWLSGAGLAETIAHGPHSGHLIDLFTVGVHTSSEDEKDDAAKYLANKIAELPEEQKRLEDGIIDLPATFSALYAATQKAP